MHTRSQVLAALKDALAAAAGVKTAVRTYRDMDISNYKEASLPLVEVREPDEIPDEEATSMRQLSSLNATARVWFVTWGESPTTTYEALTKAIRDAIGNNFTLGGKATGCWVVDVSRVEGEMPLYHFDITFRTHYCLNLRNV